MLTSVITFALYTIIALKYDTTLDITRLFTALSLIILLTQPLFYVYAQVMELTSSIGCMERIEKFLVVESRADHRLTLSTSTPSEVMSQPPPPSVDCIELANLRPAASTQVAPISHSKVISVRNGSFGWAKDGDSIVHDINLGIQRGNLTLLIGPVASGKSTLLKALLGETPSSKGFVYVSTLEAAWCEQTPWLIVSYSCP
jgi:ABC-type multidrug transport system fused ATPase/permease subunit